MVKLNSKQRLASLEWRGGFGVRVQALSVCREGAKGWIAVNGIARREVACVLDEYGRGQVFDLSINDESDESEVVAEGEGEGEGEEV